MSSKHAILLLLVVVAVLIAAGMLALDPAMEGVRAGAAFTLASADRGLAIVGLGAALGTQGPRRLAMCWTTFVGGAVFGIWSRHSALWPWLAGASTYRYLHLLGPGACLLSGLLLVASGRWRTRCLPVAAFAVAALLLFAAAINDPAPESYAFGAGALIAVMALVLASSCLRRLLTGHWAPIGERIAGSWLLTIGLLLSVVQLVPASAPMAEATPSFPQAAAPPPVTGVEPAIRPAADPFAVPPGVQGLPMGTN